MAIQATIKVYLVDGASIHFDSSKNLIAGDLLQAVADKISLKEPKNFSLFEFKKDSKSERKNIPRFIEKTEKLFEIKNDILFRRWLFTDEDDEYDDNVNRRLTYLQAKNSFIQGILLCNIEQAVLLSSLIYFVDNITPSENNLQKYLNGEILKLKKTRDWISQLNFNLQENRSQEKTIEDARLTFIKNAKNCKFWGHTIFPCAKLITPQNGKAIVSINANEGILLLNPKTKQPMHSFKLEEIHSWASSCGTFAFEVCPENLSMGSRWLLETKYGPDIASLVLGYAEHLCNQLERTLSIEINSI
eukprot:TRINITY_DN5131_c0_g2_i1.p1 TRINITY_DN5131_c0_g2~~TRINITY_DN5131_c0_g2_i1.p1  ORF type:complete len:303 (-),score=46.60 TRINITY_DN5131_c0_g2_i1:831-1739(-)